MKRPKRVCCDGAKVLQIALAAKASAVEKRWIELESGQWPNAVL